MKIRTWEPGQWGKGLVIGDQIHTWHTGTQSLNRGSPHHLRVAVDHLGMTNEIFFDALRDKSVRLLQIDPKGRASDCLNGSKLPDWVHEQMGTTEGADPWKFGAAPNIISPYPDATPEEVAADPFKCRRAFIHDPQYGDTYIGEPGRYHYAIRQEHGFEGGHEGAIVKGYPADDELGGMPDEAHWMGTAPENHREILDHVAQLHGVPPTHFGEDEGWKFAARKPTPFIYDQVRNKVLYGDQGGFHGEIIRGHYRATGERLRGYHGLVEPTSGRIEFHGTPPTNQPEVEKVVADKFGISEPNRSEPWKFANHPDDPYYDPEFDQDPMEDDKFDHEVQKRIQSPPSPDRIHHILKQGVPQGEAGKALQFSDGQTVKWMPDEYGSPHHDDVARALNKHRDTDRKYLHVDEDGRTYDLFDDPKGWTF